LSFEFAHFIHFMASSYRLESSFVSRL
jgi:hypothetical protein